MYSPDGEDNPRVFDSFQQIRASRPPRKITKPSDILHHDVDAGILKLLLYIYAAPDTPRVERNTIVVAIDGACRNNGQTNATASYGIFFAPDSPLNSNGKVPAPSSDSVHTNQKAELYALSKTLDIIEEKFGDNIQISRVVVITDSTYVVDCLAKHIWDWEYNGYKNVKGKLVVNGEVFKELHKRIEKLEGDGMDVCFWLVEREWNTEADGLANAALDTVAS
jgi:ribonuclease HI